MNDIQQAFESVIWQVLRKHYNVDQGEPRVLTYKHIEVRNPFGEMAQQLALITEDLLSQVIQQQQQAPIASEQTSPVETPSIPEEDSQREEDLNETHAFGMFKYWYTE